MSKKSTILAIDDAPANLKLLGQILSPDYRFLLATSGAAGLDIAVTQRPDLILSDVVMPEMDGHQVCKQLKANPLTQNIPVIFITSLKDPDRRGLWAGDRGHRLYRQTILPRHREGARAQSS